MAGPKKPRFGTRVKAAPCYRDGLVVHVTGKLKFFWVVKTALRPTYYKTVEASSWPLPGRVSHCYCPPSTWPVRVIPSQHVGEGAGPVSSHQFCRGFWGKGIVIVTIYLRRGRRLPARFYIYTPCQARECQFDRAVILRISLGLHLRSIQGGLTHHRGSLVPSTCDHRSEAEAGSTLCGRELGNELSKSQSSTARSQKLDALRGLDQLDNLGSEGSRRPERVFSQ